MKPIRFLPALFCVALLGAAAACFVGASPRDTTSPHAACADDAGEAGPVASYACPMHPEVRSETPGRCPECLMALVPVSESTADDGCENHGTGACCGGPAPKPALPAGHPPVPGYTVEPSEKTPAQL